MMHFVRLAGPMLAFLLGISIQISAFATSDCNAVFSSPPPDSCGCVNCPAYMPDNFMGNFYFHVGSAGNNDLANIDQSVVGVRLHFDHQYLGDLSMRLFSPAGQSVLLVSPVGFYGSTKLTDWDVTFLPCAVTAVPDMGFAPVWSNNQNWGLNAHYKGTYHPSSSCLEVFNTGPVNGNWRLEITDNQALDIGRIYNFEILFQDMTGIDCIPCLSAPSAAFSTDTSGWEVMMSNQSMDAKTYELDFGDGTIINGPNLPEQHSYLDTGNYQIRLIASNICGSDTSVQTVHIAGQLPSVSGIIAEPATGCAPLLNRYQTFGNKHVTNWHWLMPGAVPAESTSPAPNVMYNEPGNYPVMLIIGNALGADTLQYADFINVKPSLTDPGCTVEVRNDTIVATNTTQGFTEFYWTLDGAPVDSSALQQIFVAPVPGEYVVGLFIANDCDSAWVQQTVPVIFTGVKNSYTIGSAIKLSPNPNAGQFRLEVTSPENLPADIMVMNTAAQVVFMEKTNLISGNNTLELNLDALPDGLYLMRLQTEQGGGIKKFVIER